MLSDHMGARNATVFLRTRCILVQLGQRDACSSDWLCLGFPLTRRLNPMHVHMRQKYSRWYFGGGVRLYTLTCRPSWNDLKRRRDIDCTASFAVDETPILCHHTHSRSRQSK